MSEKSNSVHLSLNRPLVYLHLFKTAGTTLESIISRQYKTSEIMQFGSVQETDQKLDQFRRYAPEQRDNIRVFMGHFSFKQRDKFPQDCNFITLLRHPVDRIISEYYFILESPENAHYPRLVEEKMSLTDFVKSGLHQSLDNYQTKYLCGGDNPGFGVYSAETLEKAKENLRRYFIVAGLTEKFDESMLLLKHLFGWEMPFYVRKRITRNRPRKEEVPPDDIALIEEYNRMDLELYDFARTRFEEQIGRLDASFHEGVEIFRILNRYCGEAFPSEHFLESSSDEEFLLVLHALNDLLLKREIDKLEIVLNYGMSRYSRLPEMMWLDQRLKLELRNLRRSATLREGIETGAVRSEGEPVGAKIQQ